MTLLGLRSQKLMTTPLGLVGGKMAVRPWLPSDCAEVTHWFDCGDPGHLTMIGNTVSRARPKSGSKRFLLPADGLNSANAPTRTIANRLFANNGTLHGDDNLAWYYSATTTDTGFDLYRQELFMCALTTVEAVSGGGVCCGPGSLNGLSLGVTGSGHGSGGYRPCVYVGNNQYFLDANTTWSFSTPRLLSATAGLGKPTRLWLDGVPVVGTSVGSPTFADPTPNLAYLGAGYGGNTLKCSFSDVVGGINLTEKDRQKTEGFMVWKAGLAHLLPASHPYRFKRP